MPNLRPLPAGGNRARFQTVPPPGFQIVGEISQIETIATASGIREIARLRKLYGRGRWRKRKGVAQVRLNDGATHLAPTSRSRRSSRAAEHKWVYRRSTAAPSPPPTRGGR